MLKKIYEELVAIRKELQKDDVAYGEPIIKIRSGLKTLPVNLTNVKTSDLVTALIGREGVSTAWINPHEHKAIGVDGPAKVLIVKD